MAKRRKSDAEPTYDAQSIQVLKGLDGVKRRPAMYIGDTGVKGLHHLVEEVVDNSIDEALAGHCSKIALSIGRDGSVTVTDDGRGIPVGVVKGQDGKTGVEVVMTVLHAGAKFDRNTYKCAGGLHGVGVSCVNALSEWVEVEVKREGAIYTQRFERGVAQGKLKKSGKATKTGTQICFKPDPLVFKETTEFKFDRIAKRFKELSFLHPNLTLVVSDERDGGRQTQTYKSKNGLVDFILDITEEPLLFATPVRFSTTVDSKESGGPVEINAAFSWNDGYSEDVRSYVNNIETMEGGTHLSGFKKALTKTLNFYATKNPPKKMKKGQQMPSGDDYREGLVAVISMKVPEPQFEGQTKTKLGNSEILGVVESVVGQWLACYLEEHPTEAKLILKRAFRASDARDAARKARERVRSNKATLGGDSSTKLSDCSSKDTEINEVFFVEGDSAGGTAKQGRDPHTQAILPLRGKILNVWKASQAKSMGHKEIQAIWNVLGTGILDEFNPDKCRYGKIIIMCDADVDGSHIRTLVLTFFFKHMRQLIRDGRVFVAQPPLYGVKEGRQGLRYILNERVFQEEMLETGLADCVVEDTATGALVYDSDLVTLMDLSERFLRIASSVEIDLATYLRSPIAATAAIGSRRIHFEDRQSLDEWVDALPEDVTVWRAGDDLTERDNSDVEITFYRDKSTIRDLTDEMAQAGFEPEDFIEAEVGRFKICTKSGKQPLKSLSSIHRVVRTAGQRGLSIKRYKGLGEMNSTELWDTTMNPETRTLLRVTLEDEKEARDKFAMLMGGAVDKRRAFIESHALEAHNLDF